MTDTTATQKKVSRIVVHPNYYMRVNGNLQKIPVGTKIDVTKEQAERHKLKLRDPDDQLELQGGELVNAEMPESEAVKQLKAAQAELASTQEALKAAQAELAKSAKK